MPINMFQVKLDALLNYQKTSLGDLAKKTGVSKSTLSRYISGERVPTESNLLKITKAYKLPGNYFTPGYDRELKKVSKALAGEFTQYRNVPIIERLLHGADPWAPGTPVIDEIAAPLQLTNGKSYGIVALTEDFHPEIRIGSRVIIEPGGHTRPGDICAYTVADNKELIRLGYYYTADSYTRGDAALPEDIIMFTSPGGSPTLVHKNMIHTDSSKLEGVYFLGRVNMVYNLY